MKFYSTILVLGLILSSLSSNAQCKHFTKKHCLPDLAPYIHSGQLSSAYMMPGDSAEVKMTFNAGKEYRLLVGSQELIGYVQFNVLDKNGKKLFSSNADQKNPYWDFKVENTQHFIIQIFVPEQEFSNQKTNLKGYGCVAILLGFKE